MKLLKFVIFGNLGGLYGQKRVECFLESGKRREKQRQSVNFGMDR